MEVILNYEEDVKIDSQALDVEWLEQPGLMGRYAKHAAHMEALRDEAKERLDVEKARIEMQIRANPELYDLAKPTEAGIQSTILLQSEYQELIREFNAAKYEYGQAIAAVRAIDQRKAALENLVKLLNASYLAGPQAPRNLYQEQLDYTERRMSNSRIRMKRTRKGREE